MFQLSDTMYKIIKWSVILFLPACGTLYATLGKIWNFPCTEEVVYTISAICAFFGTILGISCAEYSSQAKSLEEELVKINNLAKEQQEV